MKRILFVFLFLVFRAAISQTLTDVIITGPTQVNVGDVVNFSAGYYSNGSQIVPPSSGGFNWIYTGMTLISSDNLTLTGTFTQAGNYTVSYEYSDVSNYFYDSFTISVVGDFCSTLFPNASDVVRVDPGTLTLSVSSAPTGYTYVWYDQDNNLVSTAQNFTTPYLAETKLYYVGFKHTFSGCVSSKVPVKAIISDYTFVKSYIPRTELVNQNDAKNGTNSVSYKEFDYFDALGRPMQTVRKQASLSGRDEIRPFKYDVHGREIREYLPYVEATLVDQNGRYRSDDISKQSAYYTTNFSDSYGFSEKQYEASPLNRVIKQAAEGYAWRQGSGKEKVFERRPNKTTEEVRVFTVNSGGLPVTTVAYSLNTLWVEISADEDGKKIVVYKDKDGRLILKKVQEAATPSENHTGWLCTYYVYDDRGLLRIAIPPQAVKTMSTQWTLSTNQAMADGQYFLYSYDGKGRMTKRQFPGKKAEFFLYDLQNRQVGFQDAELWKVKKWLYTKYDGLGRVVMTGTTVINGSDQTALHATLQAALNSGNNNATINPQTGRIKSGTSISSSKYEGHDEYVATSSITLSDGFRMSASANQNFSARIGSLPPSGNAGAWPVDEGEILSINYYDDYQLLSGFPYSAPTSPAGFSLQSKPNIHGLLAGKRVKNLDTGEFLTSAIYYDEKGRVIQTITQQQLGGTVRSSTAYNFEGLPTQSLTVNSSSPGQEVLRTFSYNVAGQLERITHKVGTHTAKTIVQNSYNELGQLTTKAFPQLPSGNQTYTYNIRGWLKTLGSGLNEGYRQTNYYESGGAANNWNGNISRIDWIGSTGAGKTRTYNYTYDRANRLTEANYSASSETNWYTVSGMAYDANGNITAMTRRNERSAGDNNIVDQLTYTYQANSNKLTQVADAYATPSYTSKDFKDRSTVPYTYDDNGNLKSNEDKQISGITYNHLNLPSEVAFNTGARIRFAYNAEGVKLSQKVYNTSGALTTTQDYIGEFVYQNGALDYLIHEEGRVASEANGLFYEYYLKDHLGNVRQVIRNPTANARIATMEQANADEEETQFTQIKPTRKREPKHNVTQGGQEVAWLNASRGEMVGPGTSQEIFEGDSVVLSVHGKFLDKKNARVNEASFATTGGTSALLDQLNELALNTKMAGGANPIAVLNLVDILAKDLQKKETPEAYLIYALYDQDSNRYEVGKKVLSRNAANQHEELEEKMAIKKNGYIETFVVNETGQDVWFDNFRVLSQGSLLVQETHYDPWGLELTGIGYEYAGVKKNKFLFNGKELIEEAGLQYYDYGARMYDPAIGRWGVVDPLADHPYQIGDSPYMAMWNNPVNFNDPNGLCPDCPDPATAKEGDTSNPNGDRIYTFSKGQWTGEGSTLDEVTVSPDGNYSSGPSSYDFNGEGGVYAYTAGFNKKYGSGNVSGFSARYTNNTGKGYLPLAADIEAEIYGFKSNAELKAEGSVIGGAIRAEFVALSAQADLTAGVLTGEGNRYGAYLGGNAGAYGLRGEVNPTVSIFGWNFGLVLGGDVGSAHIGAGAGAYHDALRGTFKVSGQANLGLGAGFKIGVEVENKRY